VEKSIASHPSVAETAVVSAPDPKWGEVPVAFVVARPKAELDEAVLKAYLLTRLAKFKIPHRFFIQTEPLPKGGTGKILKKDLRESFWQGREKRVQG
jgi:acyl-CoA synthetase (AMP-forming)/AMP-acid ligase II